jgi:hypothetical protein
MLMISSKWRSCGGSSSSSMLSQYYYGISQAASTAQQACRTVPQQPVVDGSSRILVLAAVEMTAQLQLLK